MPHPSAYQVVLTWGKYRGSTLGHIADRNPSYLDWIVGSDADEVWRVAAARTLQGLPVDTLRLPRTTQRPAIKRQTRPGEAGIVLKDKNTVAVKFPYNPETVERIKAEVDGRQWNGDTKCWEVPATQLPKLVELFGGEQAVKMTPNAQKRLRREIKRRQDLDTIRKKDDTDLAVPTKLPLFPFQRVGIEFVTRAGGRAMIADQMGLGKTAQAIGFALVHKCKTLIVCPKSVMLQWAEEIEKFAGKSTTIWTTKGPEPTKPAGKVLNWKKVKDSIVKP